MDDHNNDSDSHSVNSTHSTCSNSSRQKKPAMEIKDTNPPLVKLAPKRKPGDDEAKVSATPKRKKLEASDMTGSVTPGSGGSRKIAPLSERQQMALALAMSAQESGGSSPQQSCPTAPSTPASTPRSAQARKVNKRNEKGESPLHLATIKNDVGVMKKLLKAGADVNVQDFAGWTALHEACNHGFVDAAHLLLKKGAMVNAQGLDNDTPLHDAAVNEHPELVALLLKYGANAYQTNSHGKSPLDVARNEQIKKLLKGQESYKLTSDDSDTVASLSGGDSPKYDNVMHGGEITPRHDKLARENVDHEKTNLSTAPFVVESIPDDTIISADARKSYEEGEEDLTESTSTEPITNDSSSLPTSLIPVADDVTPEMKIKEYKNPNNSATVDQCDKPVKTGLVSSSNDTVTKETGDVSSTISVADFTGSSNSQPSLTSGRTARQALDFTPLIVTSDASFDTAVDATESFNPTPSEQVAVVPVDKSSTEKTAEDIITPMSGYKQETQPLHEPMETDATNSEFKTETEAPENETSLKRNSDSATLIKSARESAPSVAPISLRVKSEPGIPQKLDAEELPKSIKSDTKLEPSSTKVKLEPVAASKPKSTIPQEKSTISQEKSTIPQEKLEKPEKTESPVEQLKVEKPTARSASPSFEKAKRTRTGSLTKKVKSSNLSEVATIPEGDNSKDNSDTNQSASTNARTSRTRSKVTNYMVVDDDTLPVRETRRKALMKDKVVGSTPSSERSTKSSAQKVPPLTIKLAGKSSASSNSVSQSQGHTGADITAQTNIESIKHSVSEISTEKSSASIKGRSSQMDIDSFSSMDGKDSGTTKDSNMTASISPTQITTTSTGVTTRGRTLRSHANRNQTQVNEKLEEHVPPRKSKRMKAESTPQPSSTQSVAHSTPNPSPMTIFNPYTLFKDVKDKMCKKWAKIVNVQPKAPAGYAEFSIKTKKYLLLKNSGNNASKLGIPLLTAPAQLSQPLKELFNKQEQDRYKLRQQHLIEGEKLRISYEQEILRVYTKGARAQASQEIPLSVCTVLKDQESSSVFHPYNALKDGSDDKNITERVSSRSHFSNRQLRSWLQDCEEKFEKLKDQMISRHHHEAESLYAVQIMNWEWKMKECGLCDCNTQPKIDPLHVSMVAVNDDADILNSYT